MSSCNHSAQCFKCRSVQSSLICLHSVSETDATNENHSFLNEGEMGLTSHGDYRLCDFMFVTFSKFPKRKTNELYFNCPWQHRKMFSMVKPHTSFWKPYFSYASKWLKRTMHVDITHRYTHTYTHTHKATRKSPSINAYKQSRNRCKGARSERRYGCEISCQQGDPFRANLKFKIQNDFWMVFLNF